MLYSATRNNQGIVLSGGQLFERTHNEDQCLGDTCPLHNPSDHIYREDPLFFNGTHMYRIHNGETIVDPDDYLFNKNGSAILKNSAKCLKCNVEIESVFQHDFVSCPCNDVFVDGGFTYIRHGWKNKENYENTSVTCHKEEAV